MFAGEPCRIYTRRAVKRLDRQAGIISNSRQAGQSRGVLCFDQRIFPETLPAFIGVSHAVVGLRNNFDAETLQQSGHFPDLASIAAGYNNFLE